MTNGVAIGRSSRPICAPVAIGSPMACTSEGRSANGRARQNASRRSVAKPTRVTGSFSRAAWLTGRRAGVETASIISSMGVMPAIVSFENEPREYETAPTNRPSM